MKGKLFLLIITLTGGWFSALVFSALVFSALVFNSLVFSAPVSASELNTSARALAGDGNTIDIQSTTEITGLWWAGLDESGWGVTLTQQYDIIFVTLFTYNPDGTPQWYVASDCAITANICSGTLFEVSGGSPLLSPWDGSGKVTNSVGNITFSFSDNNTATMEFTINGIPGSKSIERQVFSTVSPDAAFTALWWNQSESGWGLTLTQQTDTAFATIFTYNNSGLATWYVVSNCVINANGCSGTLYEITAGSPITQAWNGSNKQTVDVGNIDLIYTDGNTGTLKLEINGVNGTKPITRQIWANAPTTDPLTIGLRDFTLPNPMFAESDFWNELVTGVDVLPESDDVILATYRVLRGDVSDQRPPGSMTASNQPNSTLNFENSAVPIFKGGGEEYELALCGYQGTLQLPNALKFSGKAVNAPGGPVTIPGTNGLVRSSLPTNASSDGLLVLFDPVTAVSYEFLQATTQRVSSCQSKGAGHPGSVVAEAAMVDFFDTDTIGTNEPGTSSARSSGVSLLAGLFVPEDLSSGQITHALALTVPGLRNLSPVPTDPLETDYNFPASSTELESYSINPSAPVAGQRLRLKNLIKDIDGDEINESQLAPITKIFLKALREYGAVIVDNADGFAFPTEDIYTGRLNLSDAQVNDLLGLPVGTMLPTDKTRWQLVVELLAEELARLPLASGPWVNGQDASTATIDFANFEVINKATVPDS
jgi:hypothetical protein